MRIAVYKMVEKNNKIGGNHKQTNNMSRTVLRSRLYSPEIIASAY